MIYNYIRSSINPAAYSINYAKRRLTMKAKNAFASTEITSITRIEIKVNQNTSCLVVAHAMNICMFCTLEDMHTYVVLMHMACVWMRALHDEYHFIIVNRDTMRFAVDRCH